VTTSAPLRVLVVDDDETAREIALLFLAQLGQGADVACDGREAVASMRSNSYDMVMMDVHMPGMDGIEASRQIRRELSEASQPMILAMSANATAKDRILYLEAGMNDVLPKPVRIRELATALGNCRPLHLSAQHVSRVDDNVEQGLESRSVWPSEAGGPSPDLERVVFDPGPLAALMIDLCVTGDDIRVELIEAFLRELVDKVLALDEARSDDTGAALAFIAHELRSTSATLGLLALCDSATRIESAMRSGAGAKDIDWQACLLISECQKASAALRLALRDDPE
jgi:CheY-like chemotaxis protein